MSEARVLAQITLRMRKTISGAFSRPVEALAHERLRLRLLFAVAFLKLFNFIGGAWDIQWHIEIGRDSLFIPPHMLVFVAFLGGVALVLAMIIYETGLAKTGHNLPDTRRIGPFSAPSAVFVIFFGYTFALLSALFDELWHRVFGIDATLWSPPHLMIMAATMVVDFSLLLGITASSRRLGHGFALKSPLLWGLLLVGAYAFESVNFQMGEAFIVGYRMQGIGLYGLLFPIMVGAVMPFSLLMVIGISKRFWLGLPILGMTLLLQYLATGVAALGFEVVRPVSVIEEYVAQNPGSTAAVSRQFARLLGFDRLIGFHQAWTMALNIPALVLVALLGLLPWVRRRPVIAASAFGAGMVVFSYLWFQTVPALQHYPISALDVAAAALISGGIATVMGDFGLRLARRIEEKQPQIDTDLHR